jgi:hypothetical protein
MQFSSAFDTYLEILEQARDRLDKALGIENEQDRLKTTCVACTHALSNEPKLQFAMQAAIDGNGSLKRVQRVSKSDSNGGGITTTTSIERLDSREAHDVRMMSREDVEAFKHEAKSARVS